MSSSIISETSQNCLYPSSPCVPVLTKTALNRLQWRFPGEGTILALKDSETAISSGILAQTRDIPGFTVLTGLEFQVDTALQMGVHGCVPGVGNVAPREYVELYELARNGEYHKARELQERMIKLFDICYQGSDQISGSASALSGFKPPCAGE